MGPSQTSEAIILRTRAYGESDKIVTFLTDDAGKLTGIAKGAKNSRRRFANCLDPFTRVRVHFRARSGASLVFMDSCDLLQSTGQLADPNKFAYGSYLVELIDQLTEEAHPVPDVYRLLREGLDELQRGAATSAFLRVFELRLLHHAGYDPHLTSCARCQHSVVSADRAFLDTVQGSILCVACRGTDQRLVPVAGQTLATLSTLKTATLSAAHQQRFSAGTAAEAAALLGHLLALHLPRPLRSAKLIAALASERPSRTPQ
ncbi:MAG: DNA repair protein RecO [Candidatus Binatia bacterium]